MSERASGNGYSVIGRPLPKVDGLRKATGQAVYADDLDLPRMLYGKLLGSRRPHARIVNIDVSRAEALPGVKAIITGKDLPVKYGILPVSEDEYPLEIDRVRFVGDPIVAVAAVDEMTAEQAVRLIDVEYEDLPTAFDIEEGLAAIDEADRIHDYGAHDNVHKEVNLEFGDLDAGFEAADHVFENTYFYSGSNHLAMEQHAAVADYGADGKLTLWSSTQTPHYVHKAMAKVLEMPAGRIRVIATPVGGGFGGKSDPFPHEFCAAKLSMLTGRPVKITLTREEVFYAHRGRHPVLMHVRLGVKDDGEITALDFQSFLDGGGYGSYGVASTYYTGALQTVTYKIPAYRFRGVRVFTNKPPCGPKRGHGTPQPRYALEIHLDRVAEALGLDPAAYRKSICVDEYTMTANHMRVTSCGLRECIDKVVQASDFASLRGALPEGKGIGLGIGSYLSGAGLPIYWNNMPHTSVDLKVDRGGGVTAKCMQIDIGQGSDSVLAMTVAEVLGIEQEDVKLICADTDTTPIDLGAYSSRVTFMMGNAAIEAAEKIREKILAAVAEELEIDGEALAGGTECLRAAHGHIVHEIDGIPSGKSIAFRDAVPLAEAKFGQLSSTGSYTPQKLGGPYKGSGVGPTPAYSYTAAVVLVDVDTETGVVTPEKVWIGHDIGRAINPTLVRGQIDGSVYMALGEILMEEQAFRKGQLQFPSMLDYKSPTFLEMPSVESFLVETDDAEGPFGAKEVGQGPLLPMPPAVANAVYDAVGVRIDELPITPEKVMTALDRKARGESPRYGPDSVPEYTWPEPTKVDPVWYDQPPEEWVETKRRPVTLYAAPPADDEPGSDAAGGPAQC
ncbi:MAG: molybdopterin-dependent oxidoreductase [Acidobacteria bacterium]|nr:molybdopterin-dependent oxidoreductase [Acidobacteriota bacterium]